MSAKEAAINDIKKDLLQHNKSFIAFKQELNPIMRKLVRKHLMEQQSINTFHTPLFHNAQLVAHCFFCKSDNTASLSNYSKYYDHQQNNVLI